MCQNGHTLLIYNLSHYLSYGNIQRCSQKLTGKNIYSFLAVFAGEGNGTPLQYSCLENPMDGGTWWAAVHGVAKTQTGLNDFTFTFSLSYIGEGNGNPLQCSCLENPRDGGAWWAAVYGVAQSRTRLKWLSSSSSILYVLIWRLNESQVKIWIWLWLKIILLL